MGEEVAVTASFQNGKSFPGTCEYGADPGADLPLGEHLHLSLTLPNI